MVAAGLLFASSSAWAFPFFGPEGHHHHHHPAPRSVPELDAGLAVAAVALIGGGAAVVHGRRRRARS
jgi:hypothetical protein